MANITGTRTIFFFTSPRTADRLAAEIKLLVENFSGQPWNTDTQAEFYRLLCRQDFYFGTATGDIAFKARDRVNRAPKALGLVDLKPVIKLTNAGKEYVYGPRPYDIFTKQLLKFQLHSPFHADRDDRFSVKPYLEFMKFIKDLNGVTKTEMALFGIQLVSHANYEEIKHKIEKFRIEVKNRDKNISYKEHINRVFECELRTVYSEEIASNNIATRESSEVSVSNFLTTKKGVHRDYADASIRYLRATTLFSYNPKSNKIHVAKDRADEVEFICQNINPVPYAYASEQDYKDYLFAADNVTLLTDDKDLLLSKISKFNEDEALKLQDANVGELKDVYDQLRITKVDTLVKSEVADLQTYEPYNDVVEVYEKITSKAIVEPPLFLEWNTWRAFTMLDDGEINGNFRIDDEGMPLYAAAGNMPDIECNYRDFKVAVEVTMSSGQKQYEMEGEPIARHYGNLKRETDREVYCIFIAPTLSPAAVAHFYGLHQISIAHYGGKAKIIPIQLNVFQQMLSNANSATTKPKSTDLRKFLDRATSYVGNVRDETEWVEKINAEAATLFTS